MFDYINAAVPVLTADLPEMKKIVSTYKVGETIELITPENIAEKINELFSNETLLKQYATNCLKAKEELCWENEQQKLYALVKEIK